MNIVSLREDYEDWFNRVYPKGNYFEVGFQVWVARQEEIDILRKENESLRRKLNLTPCGFDGHVWGRDDNISWKCIYCGAISE